MSRFRKRRFIGSRVVDDIPTRRCVCLRQRDRAVQRPVAVQTGTEPPEEYQTLVRETVRPIYEELKERSKREQPARAESCLRIFPVPVIRQRSDHLSRRSEDRAVRFTFPRQPAGKASLSRRLFRVASNRDAWMSSLFTSSPWAAAPASTRRSCSKATITPTISISTA